MQLLGDALIERAIQPAEIVRSARSAFRAPRRLVSKGIDSLARGRAHWPAPGSVLPRLP